MNKKSIYEKLKWSVYIIGQDEYIDCESFENAIYKAACVNAECLEAIRNMKGDPELYPLCYAVVTHKEMSLEDIKKA